MILHDASGSELFKVQQKELRVRDTMRIERDGDTAATVKKALVHVVRDRFSIEVEGVKDLEAKGNIVDHDYRIERDATTWPRSPSAGSAFGTPMASRLLPARTTR